MQKKEVSIHIRVTPDDHKRMTEKAKAAGFATVSGYLRVLGLNANVDISCNK